MQMDWQKVFDKFKSIRKMLLSGVFRDRLKEEMIRAFVKRIWSTMKCDARAVDAFRKTILCQ